MISEDLSRVNSLHNIFSFSSPYLYTLEPSLHGPRLISLSPSKIFESFSQSILLSAILLCVSVEEKMFVRVQESSSVLLYDQEKELWVSTGVELDDLRASWFVMRRSFPSL